MASCSGESVEAVERRKGFWWTREDTLLLISQYREHEKLFRNVNCKKKSVWELITASMAAENPNFSARPEQVEGKWKSLTLAFRKCCDPNHSRNSFVFFEPFHYFDSSTATWPLYVPLNYSLWHHIHVGKIHALNFS